MAVTNLGSSLTLVNSVTRPTYLVTLGNSPFLGESSSRSTQQLYQTGLDGPEGEPPLLSSNRLTVYHRLLTRRKK